MTISDILSSYKFSSGFAQLASQAQETKRLSSGSVSIDKAIGGGLPMGGITIVAGEQSSGKTTLCVSAAIQAQASGKYVIWNDTEFKLHHHHVARQGLDLERMYVLSSTSIEEAGDFLIDTLTKSSDGIGLIVWDSLAQSFSARSFAKDNLEGAMASSEAAAFTRTLPRVQAALYRSGVPMIATNQWRTKGIGGGGRTYRDQYGGNIIKYVASVIIKLSNVEIVRKLDIPIGQQTSFEILKNHTSAPFSTGKFDIDFDESTDSYGISIAGDLVLLGLEAGLIKKSGSWYSIQIGEETFRGQGVANLKMELRDRSDVVEYLLKTIMGDSYEICVI
jgi:recombination protein RecA